VVFVNEIEWDFGNTDDPRRLPRGEPSIRFATYGDMSETIWQPVAADLFAMLRARWRNQVRFRDGNGKVTYRWPAFLYAEL
jgi:hypothetical protein